MVGTSLTWKDAESDDSSFQNFVVPDCSPLAINTFDAPQSATKSKLSTCLARKKKQKTHIQSMHSNPVYGVQWVLKQG
jgi:hypothetical protein